MANKAHLAKLNKGVRARHVWRKNHDIEIIDLTGANLSKETLIEAYLLGANLHGANLLLADLANADLANGR